MNYDELGWERVDCITAFLSLKFCKNCTCHSPLLAQDMAFLPLGEGAGKHSLMTHSLSLHTLVTQHNPMTKQ